MAKPGRSAAKFDDRRLTARVLKSIAKTRDRRLKQVMSSFIRHMHDFVHEVKPTQQEWFAGILSEPGSYTMPVFLVGHRGHVESEILAYGPTDVADGVVNTAHALRNWTSAGEWATWDIDVRTPGRHEVTLWREGQLDSSPTLRASVGDAQVDGTLQGKATNLGIVELAAGKAVLRLELLDPGKGTSPAIDKLEKIVLRRVE